MTVPALPPGTRPGTGGYTAQLPAAAGTVGQSRRVASVAGKHHVEEWYTPVSASDISAAITAIGLGNASTRDVGTSASNVVALDGSARLPAVDGSQLTNMPSSTPDLSPIVLGSNLVQQRNGANPQELQIYEQYTSDTSRSYLSIKAETNGFFVIEPVGVGATQRNLRIGCRDFLNFTVAGSTVIRFFSTVGVVHVPLTPQTDQSQNLGSLTKAWNETHTKTLGVWGATPPTSQPATPTDQAEIIAILQAYGLCS